MNISDKSKRAMVAAFNELCIGGNVVLYASNGNELARVAVKEKLAGARLETKATANGELASFAITDKSGEVIVSSGSVGEENADMVVAFTNIEVGDAIIIENVAVNITA